VAGGAACRSGRTGDTFAHPMAQDPIVGRTIAGYVVRKAVGARSRDILAQFVIESIVMSGTGGAIGVLLAFMVSSVVDHFWTSTVPVQAVLVGLALSTTVGLFFGIYPASQAAKLDPIEALRTEN